MANKIPVGDTISFAYSNTFGNILPLLGLTWLPLAIVAVVSFYVVTLVFDMVAHLPIFATGRSDPQALMSAVSGMMSYMGLSFLVWLVCLFMTAVVGVAVTEQALGKRTGQTFVHLAAGAPEWRVFGGYIRLIFAIIGLYLLMAVGFGISMFAGNAIGSSAGMIVTPLLCIVLVCLFILTLVRMSFLLTPSIVMEPGKGGLARSYQLTGGNFWRIVGCFLVLVLPVAMVQQLLISAVIGNAMMAPVMHMMQHSQGGQAAASLEDLRTMFTEMIQAFRDNFVAMSIIGFVGSFFSSALMLSGAAFAYRALSGGAPEAVPVPAPASVA